MQNSIVVLMAEDEALIATSLQDALEHAGFKTTHVCTGIEAIKWLDLNHIDLGGLITDIRLGCDIDGGQ